MDWNKYSIIAYDDRMIERPAHATGNYNASVLDEVKSEQFGCPVWQPIAQDVTREAALAAAEAHYLSNMQVNLA